MNSAGYLKEKAIEIRMNLLKMIYHAKAGHTGGSLSSVDILVALYYKVMNIDANNGKWPMRDRFVLSKGHSVEGYYAVLADKGFFPAEELETYCRFNTRLIGHPTVHVPGIEMNTGALGHGLSTAVGMALAGMLDHMAYRVYVLMGDGEQAEGSIWEAAMSGSHYNLDNLVGIIDRNGLQISGSTEDIMRLEDLRAKWSAFGWAVQETDGNDMDRLLDVFGKVPFVKGKPSLILAKTVKGKGVSYIENVAKWHHGVPDEEQFNLAMKELEMQLTEVRCHA